MLLLTFIPCIEGVLAASLIAGVFSAFTGGRWIRDRRGGQAPSEASREPGPRTSDRPVSPSAPPALSPEPIPSEPAPEQPATRVPGSVPEEAGNHLRILVAEDNPINRKVMQLLLRRLGYEADIAVDGQEAVEMAAAKPYDAILMDLHMPRMGGIQATEEIVSRTRPVPRVVAVTADVTQQARQECRRVGMAAYLTKPVDSTLLLQELKHAEEYRATYAKTG